MPNAPVSGQGFAGPSADPTAWPARCSADPRRTSSSVLSDLVSGRHRCDGHTKTGELARREKQIGIWHRGAGADRSARTVKGVVDEIERTLPGEGGLIAQADGDLVRERSGKAGAFP